MAATNANKAKAEALAAEGQEGAILMTQEQIQVMIDAAVKDAVAKSAKEGKGKVNSVDNEELPAVKAAQTATQTAFLNEMVSIRLFKDKDKYQDDVYVNVNGKPMLIRRGIDVQVPRYIALALSISDKQDSDAAEIINGFSKDYQNNSAKLN